MTSTSHPDALLQKGYWLPHCVVAAATGITALPEERVVHWPPADIFTTFGISPIMLMGEEEMLRGQDLTLSAERLLWPTNSYLVEVPMTAHDGTGNRIIAHLARRPDGPETPAQGTGSHPGTGAASPAHSRK